MTVCSCPEDGLRCRQAVKPPLKLKLVKSVDKLEINMNYSDAKRYINVRGGSRNSLRGGGGGSGPEFFEGGGGGGVRVQVRGNFHILTSKTKQKSEGGFKPPPPLDPLLNVLHNIILPSFDMEGRPT